MPVPAPMELERLERVAQQMETQFVQLVIPGIIYLAVHVCQIFVTVKTELLLPMLTGVSPTECLCVAVVTQDFIYQQIIRLVWIMFAIARMEWLLQTVEHFVLHMDQLFVSAAILVITVRFKINL